MALAGEAVVRASKATSSMAHLRVVHSTPLRSMGVMKSDKSTRFHYAAQRLDTARAFLIQVQASKNVIPSVARNLLSKLHADCEEIPHFVRNDRFRRASPTEAILRHWT